MEINPLVMFVIMILLIFTGQPMGLVLGFAGLIFGVLSFGPNFIGILASRIFDVQTNYILVCLPLFILMGNMMEQSGTTEKLYETMHILLGGIRGGLAYASVIIGTIFAAATGVIGASVTTMDLIAIPAMLKRGYDTKLTLGVLMASGTLGMLIPPSVMLVMYASWAQISVGRLYMACYFPGFLIGALYAVYVFVKCKISPNAGPPLAKAERDAYSGSTKFKMFITSVVPPIALILIVMGSILTGIATPTESAGLGALGAIIIAAAFKKLNFKSFKEAIFRTGSATAMVMLIAAGSYIFVSCFLRMGGAQAVANVFHALALGKWGTLTIIMLILLVLGMFLDWFGILVILTPVFMPIIKELGFDPIWFGVMVCVNLQMSFLTPPFGYALFYTKGVVPLVAPGVTTKDIFISILPFCGMIAISLVIIAIFPQISLWLPSVIYG